MAAAGGAGDAGMIVAALIAGDPLAVTILDATELLDVNMDQLAGTFALVALSGLQAKPAELAHPDPRQDARHRRKRHVEHLGDFGARHPQSSERGDRLDASLVGAIGQVRWRRRAIEQAELALPPVTGQPFARGAVTDSGRHGGLRQRPPRQLDPLDQQLASFDAQTRVSVQLHPVSSLGLVALDTSSLQGGPDEQRAQELQLGRRASAGIPPPSSARAAGGHGPNQLSRAPSSVTTEPESAAP